MSTIVEDLHQPIQSKIPPEIKAAWLTALRSGEYVQARGVLRTHHTQAIPTQPIKDGDPDRYCCLGVLCDIAVKQFAVPGKWGLYNFFEINGGANETDLPKTIREWAGIHPDDENFLANMNDAARNFDTVIEIIEEHF